MKRLFAATLVAMLACQAVGLAIADDDTFALSVDNPEQYYGNLRAPGVPLDIGPDDHNNTHRGDRGWNADPLGTSSPVQLPDPILVSFVLWTM